MFLHEPWRALEAAGRLAVATRAAWGQQVASQVHHASAKGCGRESAGGSEGSAGVRLGKRERHGQR